MKRNTKKIIKNTLLGVLCLGIVGGAAAGGKALYDYSKEDLKTIHPTFHVGGLDENGEYVDTDQSLYSDLFECRGLEVELDFENDITYKVFYYDNNKDFVESHSNYSVNMDNDISLGEIDYENLNYFYSRIEITPKWTNVEIPEDKDEEDVKVVKWTNISSFANQMTIKTFKEQALDYNHFEKYYKKSEDHLINFEQGGNSYPAEGYTSIYIELEELNYKSITIIFDDEAIEDEKTTVGLNIMGTVSTKTIEDNKCEITSIGNEMDEIYINTLNGHIPQIKVELK